MISGSKDNRNNDVHQLLSERQNLKQQHQRAQGYEVASYCLMPSESTAPNSGHSSRVVYFLKSTSGTYTFYLF